MPQRSHLHRQGAVRRLRCPTRRQSPPRTVRHAATPPLAARQDRTSLGRMTSPQPRLPVAVCSRHRCGMLISHDALVSTSACGRRLLPVRLHTSSPTRSASPRLPPRSGRSSRRMLRSRRGTGNEGSELDVAAPLRDRHYPGRRCAGRCNDARALLPLGGRVTQIVRGLRVHPAAVQAFRRRLHRRSPTVPTPCSTWVVAIEPKEKLALPSKVIAPPVKAAFSRIPSDGQRFWAKNFKRG